jgi:glycerophosphoryl diester phosphodiesterase
VTQPAAGAIVGTADWRRRPGPARRPLIIAHRGASTVAPENTLPAFAAAAPAGADAVECDVHLSADGVPVVIHDDDLRRTTDAATRFPGRRRYRVGDFTADELGRLDAGSWFYRRRRRGGRRPAQPGSAPPTAPAVPTLEQALAVILDGAGLAIIEIKSPPGASAPVADAVVALVRRLPNPGRVMIISFDHAVPARVRATASEIPVGALVCRRLHDPATYLRRLGVDAFLPGVGGRLIGGRLDGATVAAVRKAGMAVIPWTVNDVRTMKRLAAAGVSGVITDVPEVAAGTLRRRAGR